MKTHHRVLERLLILTCVVRLAVASPTRAAPNQPAPSAAPSAAIALDQLGAEAGKQYSGDGLAVVATPQGARLRCVFQKLEGEATRDGLWLTSTVTSNLVDCFRVKAASLGRTSRTLSTLNPQLSTQLPETGQVTAADQLVRLTRPGLVEEYSVSMDGVRQDFLVTQRPVGKEELVVRLEVTGALAQPAAGGAALVLERSGCRIAYNRLRATDANGRELPARIDVSRSNSESGMQKAEKSQSLLTSAANGGGLTVVVNDAGAEYPVRIDPTFCDANWIGLGGIPGTDGDVYAMAADASGNLYIGGSFNLAGGVIVSNVAKWDGTSWSALGPGLEIVHALAVSGTDLYAGGQLPGFLGSSGYVAKWEGSSWSSLGSRVGFDVHALVISGSDVYAGGEGWSWGETKPGGWMSWGEVARWDGSSWSALWNDRGSSGVNALAVSGSDLYVAGSFGITKWDGSSWSALGLGVESNVTALAVWGSDLYVGGCFTTAGGIAANYIAKWDGSSWSSLGSGLSGGTGTRWLDPDPGVYALQVSGSTVYAGGNFTMADGNPANHIAKWDGNRWSALGSGMPGTYSHVSALALSGADLYAGGHFATAGGNVASRVARWDGSSWSGLAWGCPGAAGINGDIAALAVLGDKVYAGGGFTTAGGIAANCVANWDGSSWSALGSGMNGGVNAMAVLGEEVYAGGRFTTAGGIAANCIAKWDGSNWFPLGSGMGGEVYTLAVSGSNLYAGGRFTMAGGIAATNIAKWDGSSWWALGPGMNGGVKALAISGGNLYAAGYFTRAAGIAANNIAKWDGSRWSPLGSGMGGENPFVYTLAVSGSDLYAGGRFTTAGGIAATNVAKWDGSSWWPLGSGIGGDYAHVSALATSGSDLYVGGYFTTAGGIVANHIAKWDGSSWSPLGSGIGGDYPSVSALTVLGSDLYMGGSFTTAGGKISANVARAIVNPGNWLTLKLGVPGPNTNTLSYVGIPGAQYLLQFATNLTTGRWLTLATNTPTADGRGTVQDPSATDPLRFYRVSEP